MTRLARASAVGVLVMVCAIATRDASAHVALSQSEPAPVQASAAEPSLAATPPARCNPAHSKPETDIQGRVPAADFESVRVEQGYWCNVELVGSFLPSSPDQGEGGLKVERYVDAAGHECAYSDSTQLFPTNIGNEHGPGVFVLDMADPSKPVKTASLTTPAMLSPHESLVLNQKRGLLVAVAGNLFTEPGMLDVYDVTEDCRHPELRSSTPTGILGHESGFAPDGRTFYAASFTSETIVAVDLDDPSLPKVLGAYNVGSHGLSVSDDGNRLYVAALDPGDTAESVLDSPVVNLDTPGMVIFDSSEIQARKVNPQLRPVSTLTWSTVSTAQNAIPITIGGHPFVLEIDEFGAMTRVGAGRIIDIADEQHPFVVSNLRLAVHQQENFEKIAGDPSAQGANRTFGYSGHYCNVPTRVDPPIVACSMISSGLRIFDIRDPYKPREVAYFVPPVKGGPSGVPWAMSSPAFVPERHEIWFTDANSGFYALRLMNGTWPGGPAVPTKGTHPASTRELPATGGHVALTVGAILLVTGLVLRRALRLVRR